MLVMQQSNTPPLPSSAHYPKRQKFSTQSSRRDPSIKLKCFPNSFALSNGECASVRYPPFLFLFFLEKSKEFHFDNPSSWVNDWKEEKRNAFWRCVNNNPNNTARNDSNALKRDRMERAAASCCHMMNRIELKKKKKGEEKKKKKKKLTWTRLAGWKRGRRRGLSVSWTIFALPVALTEAIVVGSAELSERIETRRAVGARVRMAQIRIRLLDGEKKKKKKEGKETIHYSRFTATTHPSIWGGQTFARANK